MSLSSVILETLVNFKPDVRKIHDHSLNLIVRDLGVTDT